jgi:cell shape-determining protein MreC
MKKMIYLRSSKRNSWRDYGKYIVVLGATLILTSIFFLFRSGLQSLSLNIFSPFLGAYRSVVENITLGSRIFVPDYELEKENVILTEEVARLRQNVRDLEIAKLENDELQEKLLLKKDNFLTASILLSPPRTPYDSIVIDRGEYDGVVLDQRVMLGDRVALGVIESIYPNQANVRLFSAPGKKTEANVERTGAIVELQGEGGGNFKLEVPLGFDIKENDLVLLPGLPRRLLASVAQVKSDETSSFLSVYLQLPAPLLGNSPIYVEVR